MNGLVTREILDELEKSFLKERANRIAMDSVMNNGLLASAKNAEVLRSTTHHFSISLKQGEITNQKQSGRCWIFAALNCLRFQVMKNLNLETFELSHNYTLFYDKLDKADGSFADGSAQ